MQCAELRHQALKERIFTSQLLLAMSAWFSITTTFSIHSRLSGLFLYIETMNLTQVSASSKSHKILLPQIEYFSVSTLWITFSSCAGGHFQPWDGRHPSPHKLTNGLTCSSTLDIRVGKLLVLLCLCPVETGFGEWQTDDSREQWECVSRQGTTMPLRALVSVCEHSLPYVHMYVRDHQCQCGFMQEESLSFHAGTWLGRSESPCPTPTATQITLCLQCEWLSLLGSRLREPPFVVAWTWPLVSCFIVSFLNWSSLCFGSLIIALDFLPVRSLIHFWPLFLRP